MTKILNLCLLCLFFLGTTTASYGTNSSSTPSAIEQPATKDSVTATLISENNSVLPGTPFWVAVRLEIDKNWHAYWKNPGDAGMPPMINWDLPEGFTVNQTLWPTPKRFSVASSVGFGYEDELVLLVEITPPPSFKGSTISLNGNVRWVVCSDSTCLPGESPISLNLPVATEKPVKTETQASFFKEMRAKIPQTHDGITVLRRNNQLEVVFNDKTKEKRTIQNADFFPEQKKSINHAEPTLLQKSKDDSSQYTVVLKEISVNVSLKGILVLHTSTGPEAYHIDLPVENTKNNMQVASTTPANAKKIGAESEDNALNSDPDITSPATNNFEFEGGVALALIMAFIGGMLLNLMPCVLPVISFKVLSFIKLSGESRKLIFKHGLAFSGGVLVSFWILASLLLVLQAYGRSVGWGFQLQEPLFVAILAAFIFVFGLSLFGIFEFGTSIMAKAGQAQQKSGHQKELLGSFLSGILATAVATPCTGPFLGSAVGFAVTLPAYQALLIFTSLGLGMSFPYLALAAFPSLLRLLPKPGPWMITFKEIMGFLMMASVLWLIWVFSAQTGTFAVSMLLAGFFLLSVACWIYGRWSTPVCKKATRRLGTLTALMFFVLGSYTIVTSTSAWAQAMGGSTPTSTQIESAVANTWEKFSPERVAELRAKGIPVFIDFTAKWCLICQANHLVLSSEEVAKKFVDSGVVRMLADWTNNDETIAAELKKFGRNSVPLYVLYDKDTTSQPQILPQVLTPSTVIEALKDLK